MFNFYKPIFKTTFIALTLFTSVQLAQASQPANMIIGKSTSQPIGHYELCLKSPKECNVKTRGSKPEVLTRKRWKQIIQVNYSVNNKIRPLTDMQIHGVQERWSYPKTVGDCEDYVLLKRKTLMDQGVSPANLLITVVKQSDGSGHAVLTVRTDHGDFILDNMRNKIFLWNKTGYKFLKRQSSQHTGVWKTIKS